MHGGGRVIQPLADVAPAEAFIKIAAGGVEIKLLIARAAGIIDHMPLQLSGQPLTASGGRDVQRRQPGKQILAAYQIAAPEANRSEQLLPFHGNKGQR